MSNIPFNVPFLPDGAISKITDSLKSRKLAGDGPATEYASQQLREIIGAPEILLTPSCTHALEMSVRLLKLDVADEVIVPSFTFTSTANAIVLAGAVPVFVDIDPITQNIDVEKAEQAITSRTRAIFCINYAGISPALDKLKKLCDDNGLVLLEDNAHGLGATVNGKSLGTFGAIATQSFHETKNIQCGEGGCLVINDVKYLEDAEIMREKGTNRSRFFRGQVDKYTWVDAGSSWLLADTLAALLSAQLDVFQEIQELRGHTWKLYDIGLQNWSSKTSISPMTVPSHCQQPFHMYYLMTNSLEERTKLINHMKDRGVIPAFHYQPLHSSAAGKKYGRPGSDFVNTERAANCLLRLPLWAGMTTSEVEQVIESVVSFQN